ncbi:MAG: UDP-glucose--hexose-1-phosphate uridylyltransferase [Clostridia bacterium]|nr:UDP-glucose--hexose-1-phosphate uridylyltransferase [Clostridia bacterium]
MTVNEAITALVDYAVTEGLVAEADRLWAINSVLAVLKKDSFSFPQTAPAAPLEEILRVLLDYAHENGLIDESVTRRDLFDTAVMGALTPRPSSVIEKFYSLYEKDPVSATDYYYAFSQKTDYIRAYRIKNDVKWVTKTEYGDIDITINLSKPEKDPRLIKLAGKESGGEKYPACQLCAENEGYAGRLGHPARQNHRIIPITVAGQKWFFQYSPYVYFNEHSIFLNSVHVPMKIDREVFVKLLDIIDFLPHYFVGSNAGLPIVGGSILAHEHFQGGNYEFPMAKAGVERPFTVAGYDDLSAGVVKWPMTCLRVSGPDRERVVDLCDMILTRWKKYTDESVNILSFTDGEEHNTVTPIARMRGGNYEIDLVLRNNITSAEFPDGVYHAHPQYHHIKRENIGLIEVMGLAVLPSRLKTELETLKKAMLDGADIRAIESVAKHADWAEDILGRRIDFSADTADEIFREEVGKVFCAILEDCGVFKRDREGQAALGRFITSLSEEESV